MSPHYIKLVDRLIKSNWDFILYKIEGGYVINVTFCGSYIDITRSFRFLDVELTPNFDEVKTLADKIRDNYEEYQGREIVPTVEFQ